MGPFAGMSLAQSSLMRQSAPLRSIGSSVHTCRAHLRTSRMKCVAAAPSTVDSKPRPGEKKGMLKGSKSPLAWPDVVPHLIHLPRRGALHL